MTFITEETVEQSYNRLSKMRSCGDCTLCCKLLKIDEPDIKKKEGEWCAHCIPSRGCKIYNDRPSLCRVYLCGWRVFPFLGDHWRPKNCGLLINVDDDTRGNAMCYIHYNTGCENKWKEEPFFSDIGALATEMANKRMFVFIRQPKEKSYVVDGRWPIQKLPPLLVENGQRLIAMGPLPVAKVNIDAFTSEAAYYEEANGWIAEYGEVLRVASETATPLNDYLAAKLAMGTLKKAGFSYKVATREIVRL